MVSSHIGSANYKFLLYWKSSSLFKNVVESQAKPKYQRDIMRSGTGEDSICTQKLFTIDQKKEGRKVMLELIKVNSSKKQEGFSSIVKFLKFHLVPIILQLLYYGGSRDGTSVNRRKKRVERGLFNTNPKFN